MSIFAEHFEIEGTKYDRLPAKPTGGLIPRKHVEFDLPGELGRVHADYYSPVFEPIFVARLYHLATGTVEWYSVQLQSAQ